ncbi:MAG: DUF4835 family protein, partial [Ignavibacteriales bacterium]|nr:DUF4835 family protein [Ignavibacteriales bacterium]
FNNYYFDGLDLLNTDEKKAQENILHAVESINQVRRLQNSLSVFVKQFFDTKYKEVADSFLSASDKSVYDRLGSADQEHLSTYQEYRRR